MEELLTRLVAEPTMLGAEESGQRVIVAALAEIGLEPRDVPLDPEAIRAHPGSSPFSWEVSGKRNVVADWHPQGEGGRSLILGGHIDVVPPASTELWTSPPFEPRREGDWLYGRGAGDMKAGLAAILGAVAAIRDLDLAPRAPVQLQSVVEEECGGNGALQCVISEPGADACVIAEPHPDHITTAQVGVLWFHVDLRGAAAHAGHREEGESAIEAAFALIAALRELEREMNREPPPPYDALDEDPIKLNPGKISGGDWASTVSAECSVSFRLSTYPDRPIAELQRRVEEVIASAAAADPFLAANPPAVRYDGFVCDGFALPDSEPVANALAGAYAAVHGSPAPFRPATATTDARHYVAAGIPAVCFGPRGERIHGIDERVSLSSMVETARVLALFVRDWCGLE